METKAELEPRQRVGETEKMTVNLGVVDLGQIDLLDRKASIRTEAIWSEPPFATRSPFTPMFSSRQWPGEH